MQGTVTPHRGFRFGLAEEEKVSNDDFSEAAASFRAKIEGLTGNHHDKETSNPIRVLCLRD